MRQRDHTSVSVHHSDLLHSDVQLQLDGPESRNIRQMNRVLTGTNEADHLLADLLVALRGDEHLDARLVHVVDVRPVSLDLGVLDAAGQAVDGPSRPGQSERFCQPGSDD